MFWQNYEYYCRLAGKYPNQVAAEAGVKSTGTVTGWKNGAMPRPVVLNRLAKTLKVSVEDLLKEDAPVVDVSSDSFTYAMHNHSGTLTAEQKDVLLRQLYQFVEANNKEVDADGGTE